MMELLNTRARDRGYARLIGNVLAINTPMLGLASALGFSRAIDPEDPEQVIVTLDLQQGPSSPNVRSDRASPRK